MNSLVNNFNNIFIRQGTILFINIFAEVLN